MKSEDIISIHFAKDIANYNWFIKRYYPNFSDENDKIIGLRFPFASYFDKEENHEEIKNDIEKKFNQFVKGNFFDSINYKPIHRDIFLIRFTFFSEYFFEFIYTNDTWKLKTKNYSWENEAFVFAHGLETNQNFIDSTLSFMINWKKKDDYNVLNGKFNLPLHLNEKSFLESNYLFSFYRNDGLRSDFRLRSVYLLIDEDFDYYLHIISNEVSKISGRELKIVQQGQLPKAILFALFNVIRHNRYYTNYGKKLLDLPSTRFMFKIDGTIKEASFRFIDFKEDQEYKNLKQLEQLIEDWVEKIIKFQIEE